MTDTSLRSDHNHVVVIPVYKGGKWRCRNGNLLEATQIVNGRAWIGRQAVRLQALGHYSGPCSWPQSASVCRQQTRKPVISGAPRSPTHCVCALLSFCLNLGSGQPVLHFPTLGSEVKLSFSLACRRNSNYSKHIGTFTEVPTFVRS